MFYDDIHAPPVRQPLDFLGNVLLMVVDDLRGPERSRAFELGLGPGGREDAGAVEAGDLNGRLADPAAGSENQDVLAPLQPRASSPACATRSGT